MGRKCHWILSTTESDFNTSFSNLSGSSTLKISKLHINKKDHNSFCILSGHMRIIYLFIYLCVHNFPVQVRAQGQSSGSTLDACLCCSPPQFQNQSQSLNLELTIWLCWLSKEPLRSVCPCQGCCVDVGCFIWFLSGIWRSEPRSSCLYHDCTIPIFPALTTT